MKGNQGLKTTSMVMRLSFLFTMLWFFIYALIMGFLVERVSMGVAMFIGTLIILLATIMSVVMVISGVMSYNLAKNEQSSMYTRRIKGISIVAIIAGIPATIINLYFLFINVSAFFNAI